MTELRSTARGFVDRRTESTPAEVFTIPAWEPWMDSALCSQTDPESFFPDKGGSVREAKAICRACDVRAECLEYALDNEERFGIWGGMSERDRRKLLRRMHTGQEAS